MLGVSPSIIRTWEDRYGLVEPKRSAGGQRLYSRGEVEHLRFVKSRLDEGMQPADAHRLLAELLDSSRPPVVHRSEGGQPRILILLADRDPYAAELAEFFLQTEGYEVELSFDATETEHKFDDLGPSLTIVDLMISGGVGIDVCRELRERGAGSILAVSTLEARDEALAAGADAFLHKPLDPLQLVSTVRDLLGNSAFLHSSAPKT